ncbi:origin recognition complex subunit 3-like [Littorina saxatilis]|uniref:origin recognition complex subunit 3-like n=1 Tax=Littorina saxatilis TaxID=31220 RepID=UPI0038B500A7
MNIAESVSRGCFPFKAKGKKRVARAEDYLPTKNGNAPLQYEVFQHVWEAVDTEIQILRSDLNSKMFEDLLVFVGDGHRRVQRQGSVREIPAAALITGVNTPDHGVMFSNLAVMLRERVTPLVATLRSKDCTSVKALLSKLLAQLLSQPELASLDDEDDSSTATSSLCSMATLVKHYESFSKNVQSPRKSPTKKRRMTSDCATAPPVTIILEDTESFSAAILQDFVVTCSNYLDRLPLVLVLGIATSVTAVHRLLPTAVSSLLCMEKFQAPPSTQYLTLLIDKILMTNKFPFKLGPKVFQLLLDMFLCHHFSVINFISAFQYCMMEHYTHNPLSQFCCPTEMIAQVVKQLTNDDVHRLQRLPSVMRHIEKLPAKDLVNVLQNEESFKKLVQSLLEQNSTVQRRSTAILQLLHALTSHLPTRPLGKQIRELYSMCLESDIEDTEGFEKAFELLGLTARDELTGLVTECTSHMTDTDDPVLKDVCKKLSRFIHRLDHLEEEQVQETPDVSVEQEDLKLQRTDLRSLQKKLQELGKKKKMTPYEIVRQELLSYVTEIVSTYLLKTESVVLYEILYYDDLTTVRHHLNAAPRSAIHLGLSHPAHYLQCECCAVGDNGISHTMPDVCIAYKLHLECGQLINLYDWLQAFASILTSENQENKKKASKPDRVLQARFIQAVSELQFLGFIKPTKRKTDHVARLTWGGC